MSSKKTKYVRLRYDDMSVRPWVNEISFTEIGEDGNKKCVVTIDLELNGIENVVEQLTKFLRDRRESVQRLEATFRQALNP